MDFRLKKHRFCWSRKLYSSLNVTLTRFHCQSMKLDILRRNQVFCCWFPLFDKWKQLRLMLCLLPLNTYNLKLYVCHTNTVFLSLANSYFGISFWYRNISSVLRVTFPGQFLPVNQPKWCNGWNQGEQEENVSCPFFWCEHGINHCSISLYHHTIKSS